MKRTFRTIEKILCAISQNRLYADAKRNLYKFSPPCVSTYSAACYLRSTLRRSLCGEVYLSGRCFDGRDAADPRWGVVQPVGHLTVNEDGEGSNPSAPANFLNCEFTLATLVFGDRQARFQPAFPSAVHRFHVVVTHFLQIVRHQRGTESAATIQNEFRVRIRDALLAVALDDSFAHMNGPGKMSLRPFVVFAHVHEDKLFTRVGPPLHVRHLGFLDLFLSVVDQLQELRRVRHFNTPPGD